MNKLDLSNFPQIRVELGFEPYKENIVRDFFRILQDELKDKIELSFYFDVKSCKPYWKIPSMVLCHFYIFSPNVITVKQIINLFNIDFFYSVGNCFFTHNETKCLVQHEQAAWSFIDSEDVLFLHENIKWVEISTNPISEDLFGKTT